MKHCFTIGRALLAIILLMSLYANWALLRLLWHSLTFSPDYALPSLEGSSQASKPSERHLTHIVIEIKDNSLGGLQKMFSYWNRFSPCLLDSYPTNWHASSITLTLLILRPELVDRDLVEKIRSAFDSMPKFTRACFGAFEIRHTKVAGQSSRPLLYRSVLKNLAEGEVGLIKPSVVVYLGPECVPIHANWLNQLDYQSRAPGSPFWVMAPIYRGTAPVKAGIAGRLRLTSNGFYNLGDPGFGDFLGSAIKELPPGQISVAEQSFSRWELDFAVYFGSHPDSQIFQDQLHRFQVTGVIFDAGVGKLNVTAHRQTDPHRLILCGEAPPPQDVTDEDLDHCDQEQ